MSAAAAAATGTVGTKSPRLPNDRRALVAIDLGGESCRVSLLRWGQDGPEFQLVHRFPNRAQERADGLHWDIEGILKELHVGLRRCAEIAIEGIRSIAVDGWAVDYVRLDAEGGGVGDPFCYRDERTVAAEPALHARISAERMRELTGIQLFRINTVYQMEADKPKLKGLRWLNLPEYILYRLGGRAVAERTNATHTQLVGLDGEWSQEIFNAVGESVEMAGQLVEPGTDIGLLQNDLVKLPAYRETRLIAPACHDTASAIAAIPDASEDWAYISSGTWSLVGTVLQEPVNTAAAREQNFTNLGGADGTICFHKNVNGMWLLRQCMEEWSAQGVTISLPELIDDAAGIGAHGYVLDVDDPDLMLQGHMPSRVNAQLRRRGLPELSEKAKDAAGMASFLFHSLASRYADVLKSVSNITDKRLQRIYIMGGGSQNQLLNKLTAEATGLEVCRAGTECSTIGNFAVQLATLERENDGEVVRPACRWAATLGGAQLV